MGAFAFNNRIPAVALLLGLGMLIGPSVLDLAAEETIIGMLKELIPRPDEFALPSPSRGHRYVGTISESLMFSIR